MRIPEIRKRLLELVAELKNLEYELRRRPSTRTPVKSKRMTPQLAADIRLYKRMYPNKSHQQIAAQFDVNPGRVSEVLKGKRK